MKDLQNEAERQFIEWSVRDRMESTPRRRGLGLDEQRAQVEQKVKVERARELSRQAKQMAKQKHKAAVKQVKVKDDADVKVTVLQNRTKLVLTVPTGSTILHIKERICDGRAHNFRGTIQLNRIGLYFDGADLPDDHKIAASCQVNMSLKKTLRKDILDMAAKEPAADFKVLSGKELLQHVLAGGSLRNGEEQIAAERFVEAMRQRKRRGDESAEDDKNAMLRALQARRIETSATFVNDQQQRAVKHLSDFRAAGRTMQAAWQKATTAMHGMAELNEECWDRELLETEQPASTRFKRALDRPVPGPIVLDDDEYDAQ